MNIVQQVSWVRRHEQELHLLTVGMQTYSTDSRFSLHFQHPNDWRLQIKYARPRDEGIYECQVSIHPPRIYTVRLVVVGRQTFRSLIAKSLDQVLKYLCPSCLSLSRHLDLDMTQLSTVQLI